MLGRSKTRCCNCSTFCQTCTTSHIKQNKIIVVMMMISLWLAGAWHLTGWCLVTFWCCSQAKPPVTWSCYRVTALWTSPSYLARYLLISTVTVNLSTTSAIQFELLLLTASFVAKHMDGCAAMIQGALHTFAKCKVYMCRGFSLQIQNAMPISAGCKSAQSQLCSAA